MQVWIRTCQECGHEQITAHPPAIGQEPTDAYRNAKCKQCKSEALDYGKSRDFDEWRMKDDKRNQAT